MAHKEQFSFKIQDVDLHRKDLIITIPGKTVEQLFDHAVIDRQQHFKPQGIASKPPSITYIKKHYRESLFSHIQELLFKLKIKSFLLQNIRKHKLVMAEMPSIDHCTLHKDNTMSCTFRAHVMPTMPDMAEWKYTVFKPPQRKYYKDLDKQAELFVKTELENEKLQACPEIKVNDVICFDVFLVDHTRKLIPGSYYKERLWLKISEGEMYAPYHELFLGKKKGDILYSAHRFLQEYFSTDIDTAYLFGLEIVEVLPDAYVSISLLQKQFKLKTKKNTHQKLIEVFSYRNDLSLRRSIVEEFFKLMLSKHSIKTPRAAVLRRQQYLLDELQDNADYPVYRMQNNFEQQIEQLAQKQIQETLLIDCLAFTENIDCHHEDICHYLNLAKRDRTKEFIYFKHPIIKANTVERPVPAEELKQLCLREKALNYVLDYLARH